jgi:TonB family protein
MKNLLLKRIIPFLTALLFGFLVSNVISALGERIKNTTETKTVVSHPIKQSKDEGKGFAVCSGKNGHKEQSFSGLNSIKQNKECSDGIVSKPLKILSKTKAAYTAEARNANIAGRVSLRVTFTASGQVENISVIRGLPFGLTEQAVSAVQKIKFEPEIKCGTPISRTKTVEYNFDIY